MSPILLRTQKGSKVFSESILRMSGSIQIVTNDLDRTDRAKVGGFVLEIESIGDRIELGAIDVLHGLVMDGAGPIRAVHIHINNSDGICCRLSHASEGQENTS